PPSPPSVLSPQSHTIGARPLPLDQGVASPLTRPPGSGVGAGAAAAPRPASQSWPGPSSPPLTAGGLSRGLGSTPLARLPFQRAPAVCAAWPATDPAHAVRER